MIDMTFTLEKKVAIVVGAANGIGRATALRSRRPAPRSPAPTSRRRAPRPPPPRSNEAARRRCPSTST